MKFKTNKHLSASFTKNIPVIFKKTQSANRNITLQKHHQGVFSKWVSLTINSKMTTSSVKIKRTPIQWLERYAWHGVFIISGLFWLVVCGFIWFLSSL
ncbi:hypothetical protein [Serratia proteamaculans]|uniref:hypothetical protein n=1 Tax=Serratia proteamaculans TaxID=28151 RepID=UPI0028E45FC9|nr:hypothetical protein [Serratia proteamaculans]